MAREMSMKDMGASFDFTVIDYEAVLIGWVEIDLIFFFFFLGVVQHCAWNYIKIALFGQG